MADQKNADEIRDQKLSTSGAKTPNEGNLGAYHPYGYDEKPEKDDDSF